MSDIGTIAILDAVTLVLHRAYPDRMIYSDEVLQGFNDGDLIVTLISAGNKQFVGERFRRSPMFDVIYYPTGGNEDAYGVADQLCGLLELVELPGGGLLRGTGMTFEITDGTLHFHVIYPYTVKKTADETHMEQLNLKQGE